MVLETGNFGVGGFRLDTWSVSSAATGLEAIPPKLLHEASSQVAFPIYLVELVLRSSSGEETVLRLSSAGKKSLRDSRYFDQSIVWFGEYDYQSVAVSGLSSNGATLSLDNSRNRYSFFAFSDEIPLKEQKVRVWLSDGQKEELPDDKTVLIFDGYVDSVTSVTEKEVTFTALAQSIIAGWSPRIFLAPPMCNHLPRAGTKIGTLTLIPAKR